MPVVWLKQMTMAILGYSNMCFTLCANCLIPLVEGYVAENRMLLLALTMILFVTLNAVSNKNKGVVKQ